MKTAAGTENCKAPVTQQAGTSDINTVQEMESKSGRIVHLAITDVDVIKNPRSW